ncbi:phage minor tail protein L [Pseudomonas sp. NPDC086581]|uniref:phage minor tail protein L n=1 Tax=Pseudomonas sp. NPDC086581 TaxID=3364432 RepID=UPI003829E443
MTLKADVQRLQPGDQIVLYELDGEAIGAGTPRFHPHLQEGPIWWQGQQYDPWPVEASGWAVSGDGRPASPTLSLGNLNGRISALCLRFADFVGVRVTFRETFVRYLDARNFPQGNPNASSEELTTFADIRQKVMETPEVVRFRLASPDDMQGEQVPARQISTYCSWAQHGGYRGADCGYTGALFFDARGNPVSDPSQDVCGGCLSDCKKRFGANNPLPFGGCPGAGMMKG